MCAAAHSTNTVAALGRRRRSAQTPSPRRITGRDAASTATMASRGKRIGNMQGLKSKVAAEKAAQGALEENAGARRKLRKAVAARDAAYGMDDGAEALLLRALDAFADRVAERAADHALHREGEDAEVSAVDAQLCLEGRWGVDVPGVPAATPARPAPRREAFAYQRVDPTAVEAASKKRKAGE